jgi:hypothetical protein
MYVICFYWQGDRWQEHGYTPEYGHVNHLAKHLSKAGQIHSDLPSRYVNNLYYGVKRFADRPFKFICFTNESLDLDKHIEIRPFPMITKSGVLPRLYMFSEASGLFGQQVLCLDIDIIIVGPLAPIMGYNGFFCSRSNYFGKGGDMRPGGDIMSFRAGTEAESVFWKPFIHDVKKAESEVQGRERFWIWKSLDGKGCDLFDNIAPNKIYSYKIHHINGSNHVPNDASIISFHGVPRPHEVYEQAQKDRRKTWIKRYWV